MKPFGVMADLHCANWSAFASVDENGVNTRLQDILRELDRCCQKVLELGGNYVVIAGDVFHTRGSITPSVFNPLKDRLDWWTKNGIYFTIIPGNHDLESADSRALTSAVNALQKDGVLVFETVRCYGEPGQVYVPWYTDHGEVFKTLAAYAVEDAVAFIHAGINGVLPGMPPKALDPAALASLGYKYIFAGHFHNHKHLGGGIYSIGSPTHQTWSDVGSKSGWLIVSDAGVQWYASHAPSFVEITGNLDEEELPFVVDGHFVKAKLGSATPTEIAEARRLLMEMGAKGVLIQAAPKSPGVRVGAVKASLDSLDQAVAEWAASSGLSSEVIAESQKLLAEVRS